MYTKRESSRNEHMQGVGWGGGGILDNRKVAGNVARFFFCFVLVILK